MYSRMRRVNSRRIRAWLAVAGALAVAAPVLAATMSSTASAKPVAVAAALPCGTSVPVGPANKSGIYATLSSKLKQIYSSYPYGLSGSVWAHSKAVKGPWKIGYIAFAIAAPYNQDLFNGLKNEFAKAKAKGLVTGSLLTSIPATLAASTPEQQISAIQSMVRQGVSAIILEPVGGASEAAAVDAAGKAGVPVILADSIIQQSKYGIAVWSQNQTEADAGTIKLMKPGPVLEVRGIAGNEEDDLLYNQSTADLKVCPKLKLVGTVYGNWDNAGAKTAVGQFLLSHPQPLAGVIQDGGMMPGVIEAFNAAGKPVPPIADGECQGGDLSWWLARKATYKAVGGCFNGFQGAYTFMDATMRILAGHGPKFNVLSMPAPTITNANIAIYATPNEPLTWTGEQRGPLTAWCDDTCLNTYFNTPGPVTK